MTTTFEYRVATKIVAVVDLVISTIVLLFLFGLTLMAAGFLVASTDKEIAGDEEEQQDMRAFSFITWIVVAIVSPAQIVQFVASVKLLNSTQIGKEASEAVQLAHFWKITTLVFLIIAALGLVVTENWFVLFGTVLIRGFFLYIGSQYIDELGRAIVVAGSIANTAAAGNMYKI